LLRRRWQADAAWSDLTFSRARHEHFARRGIKSPMPRLEVTVANLPLARPDFRSVARGANWSQRRNHLAASRRQAFSASRGFDLKEFGMPMLRMNRTAPIVRQLLRFATAAAVMMVTLAADPQSGHAQGIVRGAQQGAYEGNRVAGPVGGVVGGAVGAGVGGAVGAVEGVLGVPHHSYRHHYRCRGYYDSYGYYHCFQ
jgi:hypothetical protein